MGYYAKVSDKPSRYMITPMLKCVTPNPSDGRSGPADSITGISQGASPQARSLGYGHCSPSLATGQMLMCPCCHVDDAEHYILCSKPACQAFRPKC